MSVKHLSKGCLINHTPIKITKLHPDAEVPFKEESESHAASDIIVISRCDNRAEDAYGDVNTFSTGLIITPPQHYHAEVIAHPSLWKTGYMLTSTTIINGNNQEELVLGLYKFKECEDLELPFKVGQLLLRLTEYAPIKTELPVQRKTSRMPIFDEEEFVRPLSHKSGGKSQQKKNHMF